jgi:hypothetical protein
MKSYFAATRLMPNGMVGEKLKLTLSSTDYLYDKCNVLSESKKEEIESLMTGALNNIEFVLKEEFTEQEKQELALDHVMGEVQREEMSDEE